jgi:methyl-accepting chemotaxis protein
MTKRLTTTAAAAVATLALVAAGCGGGGDTTTTEAAPAGEWADDFCTAITTWTDALKNVTDQFTDLSSFSEEGLRTASEDVKAATDTLVADLKGLGAPDTESGDEVKSSIDELSTTLESELETIQTTVDDTSGITELPAAARDIATSLSAMSTAFSSTLSTIEDADAQGELRDALEASPACSDITG